MKPWKLGLLLGMVSSVALADELPAAIQPPPSDQEISQLAIQALNGQVAYLQAMLKVRDSQVKQAEVQATVIAKYWADYIGLKPPTKAQ